MPMNIHLLFDVLAWGSAYALRRWSAGYFTHVHGVPSVLRWRYTLALLLGAANGAMLCGSVNLWFQFPNALGHSVLGAIIGGIITVELFKYVHRLHFSTGVVWAMPVAVGIAVGRLGCFFAGLQDYTYGVVTAVPWAADFGDGVMRHPVQLYESAAMILFALGALVVLRQKNFWFLRNGFYLFALYYGIQRFIWEFLKPYHALVGHFNLFHFLCLALIGYALLMLFLARKSDDRPHSILP
jgi:phosphatidylglycerol:prolipoprotein diacylglycerol transferase